MSIVTFLSAVAVLVALSLMARLAVAEGPTGKLLPLLHEE